MRARERRWRCVACRLPLLIQQLLLVPSLQQTVWNYTLTYLKLTCLQKYKRRYSVCIYSKLRLRRDIRVQDTVNCPVSINLYFNASSRWLYWQIWPNWQQLKLKTFLLYFNCYSLKCFSYQVLCLSLVLMTLEYVRMSPRSHPNWRSCDRRK